MKDNEKTTAVKAPPGWRFRIGIIIFVVGFLSPLLIPVIAAMGLPTAWKAAISGLLAVGIPEVFSLVAIAVVGKSGFKYLKGRIFALLRKYGPPDVVSRTRYRIGLVMFLLPLLFGWLAPYLSSLIPFIKTHCIALGIIGDALFVVSLFVLGGDFWDKLRALFIHGAKAKIPVAEGPSTHSTGSGQA
jgi:hypothetical protein